MDRRIIRKNQLLIVRGSSGEGLTARGRVMQSPIDQIVNFQHPNKYHNIRLKHIRGPMRGVHVQFAIALARKARVQPLCLCGAYPYPHKESKKCLEL
jgi:hypothetical protein